MEMHRPKTVPVTTTSATTTITTIGYAHKDDGDALASDCPERQISCMVYFHMILFILHNIGQFDISQRLVVFRVTVVGLFMTTTVKSSRLWALVSQV